MPEGKYSEPAANGNPCDLERLAAGGEQHADRDARIVRAMAAVACEQGFAGASVASVCARAKVSARTFYAAFGSRESCFMAVMDEVYEHACTIVARAFAQTDSWPAGIRTVLAELLLFFDEEPELARVCLVESLASGPWALDRRERHVAAFTRVIVEHWADLAPPPPHSLASAGVVGSVLAILQRRVRRGGGEPLLVLLGPLVALATSPYLSAEEVTVEVEHAEALARTLSALCARRPTVEDAEAANVVEDAEAAKLPAMIRNPRSYRARRCLAYLAEHPGASNREVARAVGIVRDTQVSTLLARLADMGLLVKREAPPGGANAWSLTPSGQMYASHLDNRHSHV